jgi:hypothetical protein
MLAKLQRIENRDKSLERAAKPERHFVGEARFRLRLLS